MPHRLLPLLAVALGLAPGTWLRTEVPHLYDVPVSVRAVNETGAPLPEGWALEGVWEYTGSGQHFGGFSALIALAGNRLRAFSDRGARLTIVSPDQLQIPFDQGKGKREARQLAYQPSYEGYANELWDIEAATRDPETGDYWLGHEFFHAIQRFDVASRSTGLRVLEDEVGWSGNSGAEAMVRLRDGRFLVIPESGREVLVYPEDPVEGSEPSLLTYVSPQSGFGITDAVELPDGRLLILLRQVAWAMPPFEGRVALAEMPGKEDPQELRPKFALDLTAVAPRDNYEGIAVRARGDGTLDVWLVSDDNYSAFQRTLLVKLRLDPALLRPLEDHAPEADRLAPSDEPADTPLTGAKQRARE